jgi:hypothetical protein
MVNSVASYSLSAGAKVLYAALVPDEVYKDVQGPLLLEYQPPTTEFHPKNVLDTRGTLFVSTIMFFCISKCL